MKNGKQREMYKPLPKELRLGFSDIHDIGLFAKENIPVGTNFGMTHIQISDTLIRTPLGGFLNHSNNPNCEKVKLYFTSENKQPAYNFSKWNLVTIKNIKKDEEITLKYTFYKI
jgi:SET domain-containing protein